ncbi:outer membrane protein assembly factor BamE [Rhizobium sp. PAMB 3182]
MSDKKRIYLAATLALAVTSTGLAGCESTSEVFYQGYVVDEQSLALVPVGSSREQVLLALGTPSTTATFDTEVFYYISQKRERSVAFMKQKLISQTILAIYFGKDGTVERKANYTLQDGKVFDMISRTTPTGGKDLTFLQQLLSGGAKGTGAAAARNIFGGK